MESRGALASQPRVGPILRVELRELRGVGFSSIDAMIDKRGERPVEVVH